ncbi:MAG: signal peptidase I [Candidatus Dadabacteria bacterium]|nr:MAG: signal peptidase I [Candidatus Dadabacteria bacterium]
MTGVPDSGAPAPFTTAPGASAPPREKWWQSLLLALLAALAIRHFLIQAYKIPSGSMIPSLLIGDQLIASKFAYGIRLPFFSTKLVHFATPGHGEIVVFRFPEDPSKDFIKRTIALPGERIRIEQGIIYVNDQPIPRQPAGVAHDGQYAGARLYQEQWGGCSYMVQYSAAPSHPFWNMPEVQLGPDEIFVMGDNRDHSNDSRFWGTVNLDLLEGQPLFIHFSWDSEKNTVRWDRIGTGLLCGD